MPYQWVKPDIAVELGNKTIYHTYVGDDIDDLRRYWYTTDMYGSDGDDVFSFDIRDFVFPDSIRTITPKLRYLISNNLIKFP